MVYSKPDPDRTYRSGSRAREGGTEGPLIPCPPDLQLTEAQVFALVGPGAMPEWAIEPCMMDFRLGVTAKPDMLRPIETWRAMASKHVWTMWQTPGTRPQKPQKPLSPEESRAAARARRRELAEERRRGEATWQAYIAEAAPPPPEAIEFMRRAGLPIPGAAKPPRPLHQPDEGTRPPPTARLASGVPENAPTGRLGGAAGGRP